MNQSIKSDVYDIKSYTDTELYNILDLINPSDRELEAQIIFYIRKYQEIQSADSKRLEQFFQDIYKHFFITNQEENDTTIISLNEHPTIKQEGFDGINLVPTTPATTTNTNTKTIKNDQNIPTVNFTKSLEYLPNNLNPLLKQTIKRMVVVDSQFREWQKSYSTNFTVNFSEVLKDVVSLSLTSFQIPYTWYTINNDYGSNFFYIKGNSPGIDNGYHDYKIEIPPGNYTANGINDTISSTFNTLKQINTDICFNNTDICYNIPNCKSTLRIGITDIYDYSNYVFSFGKWQTPNYDVSNQSQRKTNIASFLGFNYDKYSTNSFYSSRTISQSLLTSGTNDKQIDNSNNKIQVIQYWDTDSFSITDYRINSNNTSKYFSFDIILDTAPKVSASNIVTNVNEKMKNSIPYLDPLSELILVPITDSSDNNYGKSFFKWTIKLNRKKTVNQINARTVILLPDISNDPIWVGPRSLFGFKSIINELNYLTAETLVVNQSFDFSGSRIKLKCTLSGYDLPINDISYSFSPGNLSLNNFLDQTQTRLFKYVGNISSNNNSPYIYRDLSGGDNSRKTDLTGSLVKLNSDSKIEFKFDIIRTIYGNQFEYDISQSFFNNTDNDSPSSVVININDISNGIINENEDRIYTTFFKGTVKYANSYSFSDRNRKIMSIKSKSSNFMRTGITYNIKFDINSTAGGGITGLSDTINGIFRSFSDSPGSYPVNNSSIVFTQDPIISTNYNYVMTIIVKKILTETNYTLVLDTKDTKIENSVWYDKYKMISDEILYKTDFSYNIIDFSQGIIVSPKTPLDYNYNYDLSDTYLEFNCKTPGYISSGNMFRLSVPNNNYTLLTFTNTLQQQITNYIIKYNNRETNIDISGTSFTISDNKLNLKIKIINHLNNVNYFNFTPGNILIDNLYMAGSYNNINSTIKTFFGKLPHAINYPLETNRGILMMDSNNPIFMSNVRFLIAIIDQPTSLTYLTADEFMNSINNTVKNYKDLQGGFPLKNSSYNITGKYSSDNFTFLFEKPRWNIISDISYVTMTNTEIKFDVIHDTAREDSIYIDTTIAELSTTDISLSFDVSYNTTGTNITSSRNRQFNISNASSTSSNIYVSNNNLTSGQTNTTYGLTAIPLPERIGDLPPTSGNYHVSMNITSGQQIQFKLNSNDNTPGRTTVFIKNFTYSYNTSKFPIYHDWSLNICLDKQIPETEYSIRFSDIHYANNENSLWYTYFDFSLNPSTSIKSIVDTINYTLSSSNYVDFFNNNSVVKSKEVVELDVIDLSVGGISNVLWLKPYQEAEGVYDIFRRNDLSFNIPAAIYNSTENLVNVINNLFYNNLITRGTTMTVPLDGYCQIHWNINKVYYTSDYKLVFYDTASFVKCFIGNTSYRNSSPDSTLGWILGFHACPEYILKDGKYISKDNYYVDQITNAPTKNEYTITKDITYDVVTEISITGDTIVNVELYKYLMIIIDDYTQNHLNDGLVTIAQKDNSLVLPSYASRTTKYNCDPITRTVTNTGITSDVTNNLTQNQLYSINQIINAQNTKLSLISAGPFVKDVFAMIPLDVAGKQPGQIFTDKVTAVQDRVYFGPVNIHKLAIKLINDKGDVLDLNGANWSLQLLCEQLYQTSPISVSNTNSKTE
jgi:hypothetical protein